MLELKIQCDCGQRYAFDVEPVNGQMPFTVNCPGCGADGTERANDILRTMLQPTPAVEEGSQTDAPSAPQVPTGGPKLRINIAKHTPSPVAESAPEQAAAGPASFTPQPQATPQKPPAKPSFLLGLLGAITGALVGGGLYFLVFNHFGMKHKAVCLVAIGTGYVTGLLADLFGRKEGSKELGMIAATFALGAVVGAQYFVAQSWWKEGEAHVKAPPTYEMRVAEAKKVLEAMPNTSDDEIRVYLAKEESLPDEKVDPKEITAEDIQYFRGTTLPELQDLATGKMSKGDFDAQAKAQQAKLKKYEDQAETTFKTIFFVLLLGKWNLVSLATCAGLAYKVCANA